MIFKSFYSPQNLMPIRVRYAGDRTGAQLLGALPYMRLLIIFSCVPPGVGLLCQVGGHVCGDELAEEAAEQPGPLRGVQPHVPLEQPHLLLLPSHQCHRHVAGGPGYVVFSSNLLDFMPCRRSGIQILFYCTPGSIQPHFPLKNVKFKEQIPYPVNFERYDSERKKLDPKHRIFSVSFTLKKPLSFTKLHDEIDLLPLPFSGLLLPFRG